MNTSHPAPLELSFDLIQQMRQHITHLSPEEACGLVAGRGRVGQIIIPVANQLHSPVRFRMDPFEQLEAFKQIELLKLEMIAIYHSHPAGPFTPSATDIAEAYYPDISSLIWYYADQGWQLRAYLIEGGGFKEIKICTTQASNQSQQYGLT